VDRASAWRQHDAEDRCFFNGKGKNPGIVLSAFSTLDFFHANELLRLNASGVSGGLRFCELCENVNNFSGKCLPATAIREKTFSSSTLTGSRARREFVPILPAA